MRRAFLALGMLAALGGPAAAQQGGAGQGVDLSVCRFLPRHVPAPDVEHRPGQDVVNGKPVAPADLPGSAGSRPFPVEIPVTLDFARRMGMRVAANGLPGTAEVGRLTIVGNQVQLNGQPLGGRNEAQLYALCKAGR